MTDSADEETVLFIRLNFRYWPTSAIFITETATKRNLPKST